MRIAIGMLIWLPSPNSSERMTLTAAGNVLSRRIPTPMQSATHRVRYRSKRFSVFSFSAATTLVSRLIIGPSCQIDMQTAIILMYHIANCQCEGCAMSLREYERVMKSVADPTRVRILKVLEAGGGGGGGGEVEYGG